VTPIFLGFPPPDHAIRNVLTKGGNGNEDICHRMLHFLFELFEKTSRVIVNDLKEATTPSQRIIQFREFMTAGQKVAGVGEKRKNFYHEVAVAVETVSRFPIKLLILTCYRGYKKHVKLVLSRCEVL
jgi:hypothetical protein